MDKIKQILLYTLLILVILIAGCSNNNTAIIEATYSQLSSSEKAEVVDQNEATIIKVTASELNNDGVLEYYLPDIASDSEEELYLVIFESENKDIVGNVEKLVNVEDYSIVGFNLRD